MAEPWPVRLVENWGFVACVILLAGFSVAFRTVVYYKDIRLVKLPMPLKAPLTELDIRKLSPYELIHVEEIKPEVLDSLGTDQYIQWYLRDGSKAGRSDPEDLVHCFVTYYTGQPDQVPHVPEECLTGAGYRVKNASFMDLEMPGLGPAVVVPVQILEFESSEFLGRGSRVVMYTFHTNGQFCAHRRCVQQAVANPYDRYAYFSKVEVTCGTPDMLPGKEQAIESQKRFMQKVIPILLADHWPDWARVDQAGRPPAAAEKGPQAEEKAR